MDATFTSVGVGGIFALLVIKEVMPLLLKVKTPNSNGTYSNLQDQENIRKVISESVIPLLNQQAEILSKISESISIIARREWYYGRVSPGPPDSNR